MKKILFTLMAILCLTAQAQLTPPNMNWTFKKPGVALPDSIVKTTAKVVYDVNPQRSDTVAIVAESVTFSFIEPKGITTKVKHYTVNSGVYTLFETPTPTFISKEQLDVMIPGYFHSIEQLVFGNLYGQAVTRQLYNTNGWTKRKK